MPKRIPEFDPTIGTTGNLILDVAEGCVIELWNESAVTLEFETTYGDFYVLPAGFLHRFRFDYTVTELQWIQLFTIQGQAPITSRIYGLKYSPTESRRITIGDPVAIPRFVNIGDTVTTTSAIATSLLNIGDPSSVNPVIRIINASSLSDNVNINNSGGITLRNQAGDIILQTHLSGGIPYLQLGSTVIGIGFDNRAASPGAIIYPDANGQITQDAVNLVWDIVNGRLGIGTNAPTSKLNIVENDAATNTILVPLRFVHTSSAVPASGGVFGSTARWQAHSSTNVVRTLGDIEFTWATSTDATRKARCRMLVFDTAVREVMRGETDGANPMVGFLGAAAVVRQVLAAAATDLPTVITLANSLRTALINLGLGV